MTSKSRWLTDETGYPLRWTISPISSRWYSPRAYDTWHVPLQASTRCIMVRAPRAMWMQNASFSPYCEKCPLRKCGWWIEKNPPFSTIVLNGRIYLCERVPIVPPLGSVASSDLRHSMKCLSVLIPWSILREILFLSSAENIRELTMAIRFIIIRVVFFNYAKSHEVP